KVQGDRKALLINCFTWNNHRFILISKLPNISIIKKVSKVQGDRKALLINCFTWNIAALNKNPSKP
ncbi:MAG: hypothetical protein II931_04595, partial [Clostridia bacterium]|nr:hypothetical protein [Clostridia bacterium]